MTCMLSRYFWTRPLYLRATNMALSLTSQLKPWEARKHFRTDKRLFGTPSGSYSLGSLQANVAILPSSFADDFSEFCRLNKAPCPIVYRSQRGQLDTPMSKGSDIRYLIVSYVNK